jgi:hypothetical protein
MEPHRGFGSRQVLLPHEIAVCEAVGITKDEYFEFFDLLTQEKKTRSAEYGHIPDVRNDPVTAIVVNLVVGIALTAVGALLAPKPRAPEQKEQNNFQGSDVKGRTKFSPLRQFDSVQELATLSSVVPLIYTRQDFEHGGVRAESQLLWSQMRNRKTYQALKAIMLFSGGRIERRPDFDSFAFGSQKIGGYSRNKIEMVFKTGGRDQGPAVLNSADQYPEGLYTDNLVGQSETTEYMFDSYYPTDGRFKALFCSVQTPTTSAQFGQYNPMANGTGYRYPFDAPGKGDGESSELKNQIGAKRQKHISGYFSREAFIRSREGDVYEYVLSSQGSIYAYLPTDDPYELDADLNQENHWDDRRSKFYADIDSRQENGSNWAEDSGNFGSAINACDQSRIDADVSIEVGDLFLLGDEVIRCINKSDATPWEVIEGSRNEKRYTFESAAEYGKYRHADDGSARDLRVNTYGSSRGYRNIARTDLAYPLQRVSIGAVSTSRAVDMVEIGIKSTVWRQVNGYPNVTEFLGFGQVNRYAKDGSTFNLGTINAYHERMAFFRVEYRKAGDDESWADISPERPFAVYGNNPSGVYNMIRIVHANRDEYEYRFIPISGNVFCELGRWASPKDIEVNLLQEDAPWRQVGGRHGPSSSDIASFKGIKKRLDTRIANSLNYAIGDYSDTNKGSYDLDHNQNPNVALCDYYTFDAEDSSHRSSPEHEIVWMNEFVDNKDSWYENPEEQYARLAYAGVIVASSREYSSFSELSAYFTRGIQIKRLIDASGSFDDPELNFSGVAETATCLFPEVAYDLLSNKFRGAGELVGRGEVHDGKMKLAARYCQANNFYWDGVMSQKVNLRQFIFEQAGYCMLDFTIVGGMFALVPSLPYNSDFSINESANVNDGTLPIAALFTDGNMRNYKVTFLSPEERQMFIAEVKYREETVNGFPTEQSFRLRIAQLENDSRNEGTFNDPVEVFDMTQFCTTKGHAMKFAKYALRTRQHVDHAIEFETTPDAASALEPGAYIRVASEITHHYNDGARFSVGSIDSTGVVQSGQTDVEGKQIFYWKPGMEGVRTATLGITNNLVADSGLRGTVFSVKPNGVEPRLYKVESISLTEDGMVDIAATHAPTNPFGQLKVLQWDDSEFVEEE